jgi:hypothetical protein
MTLYYTSTTVPPDYRAMEFNHATVRELHNTISHEAMDKECCRVLHTKAYPNHARL